LQSLPSLGFNNVRYSTVSHFSRLARVDMAIGSTEWTSTVGTEQHACSPGSNHPWIQRSNVNYAVSTLEKRTGTSS